MTTGEALHRAILQNPDDDTVRLVYADWLDENRQHAKAEFIRAQCELATFDSSYYLSYDNRQMCENSAVPLIKRSAELLHDAWSSDLLGDRTLPLGSMNEWQFRRGFFSRIEIPVMEFMRLVKVIFRHHPVQKVRLTDCPLRTMDHFIFVRIQNSLNYPDKLANTFRSRSVILPVEFKMLLKRGVLSDYRSEVPFWDYEYDTEEFAHEDLSQACVAFGRQLVGLDQPTFEMAGEIA